MERILNQLPKMFKIYDNGIPCICRVEDAINRFYISQLRLEGAKKFIPNNEDCTVILIQIFWINTMMNAMVGRCNNYLFQPAHFINQTGVIPELEE